MRLGLSVPGWSRKLRCGSLVTCVILNRWDRGCQYLAWSRKWRRGCLVTCVILNKRGWGCQYLADPESWGVAVRFCGCSENSLDSLSISPEKTMVLAFFSVFYSPTIYLHTHPRWQVYSMGICRACTQENIPELEKIYKLHCTMVEVLKNCCENKLSSTWGCAEFCQWLQWLFRPELFSVSSDGYL